MNENTTSLEDNHACEDISVYLAVGYATGYQFNLSSTIHQNLIGI